MSSPIITGPARILQKWRGHRNREQLPLIQLEPVMTDDDTEFWGEMLYFRGLLDHIAQRCDLDSRIPMFDPAMSTKLDVALDLLRNPMYDWTIPSPAVA